MSIQLSGKPKRLFFLLVESVCLMLFGSFWSWNIYPKEYQEIALCIIFLILYTTILCVCACTHVCVFICVGVSICMYCECTHLYMHLLHLWRSEVNVRCCSIILYLNFETGFSLCTWSLTISRQQSQQSASELPCSFFYTSQTWDSSRYHTKWMCAEI